MTLNIKIIWQLIKFTFLTICVIFHFKTQKKEKELKNSLIYIVKVLFWTILLLLFYILWSKSTDPGNLLVMGVSAMVSSMIFQDRLPLPSLAIKKLIYFFLYIPFLFKEIIKANIDVASRVIKPVIPINPGIIAAKTKLKSKVGRMILANSITLTPGTLSVDIKDDTFYIHCIDLTGIDEKDAGNKILSAFEKYLEVIYG